jgi:hypothetical protein
MGKRQPTLTLRLYLQTHSQRIVQPPAHVGQIRDLRFIFYQQNAHESLDISNGVEDTSRTR